MKTPIDEIYKIKKFREERAERELASAEENLGKKKYILTQKKEELSAYQKWRVNEEDRKYDELIKKTSVKRRALDDLKLEIKSLRDKETDYHQAVAKAEDDVVEAENMVKKARDAYIQSVKNSEKMFEMQHSLREELMSEAVMSAEKEIEDSFKYKPREII